MFNPCIASTAVPIAGDSVSDPESMPAEYPGLRWR